MSKKNKYDPITVPVYEWPVYVALGIDELKGLSKKWEFPDNTEFAKGVSAYCQEMVYEDGDSAGAHFNVMYFDIEDFAVGKVVHECVHAVHQMMEQRGIPINVGNTEVMAYCTEWLVERVLARIALS